MTVYIKDQSFTCTMHIAGESGGFEIAGNSLRFNSASADPQQFWFLFREYSEGGRSYEIVYKRTLSDGSVMWPVLVAIWQLYPMNPRESVGLPCYVQGQNTPFGTSSPTEYNQSWVSGSRGESRDSSWRGGWAINSSSLIKPGINNSVTLVRPSAGYLMGLDRQTVDKNWVSNICCASDHTISDLEKYAGKVFLSKKPLNITLNVLEMGVEDPVTL